MKNVICSQFQYNKNKLFVLRINDKVLFLVNDLYRILGYKPMNKFVKRNIPKKHVYSLKYKDYKANVNLTKALWHGNDYSSKTFVDEAGMYRLIFGSHMPKAEQFEDWVTEKVLPSIRKHGGYVSNSTQFFGNMNNSQIDMLEHTLDLVKKRNNQNKKLRQNNHALAKKKKQMTPTYDYGRGMSANIDHTFTTKEAAHIFSNRFNLTNCGTVNFNRVLRSKPMSVLSNQKGKNHNLPRKYYIDHKWCIVHYSHIVSPIAHKKIVCRTVYFTAKGVKGILDKFKQNRIFIPYKDWNPAVLDTKWLDKNYIYKNKKYLEHCGGKGNINKIHYVQDIL